jgi:hypothetical protein
LDNPCEGPFECTQFNLGTAINIFKLGRIYEKSAANVAFQLCADFALFPDGTPLGSNFTLAGFNFVDLSGAGALVVATIGNEKGLQFDPGE